MNLITFKNQLNKLKENWLIILLVVLVLIVLSGGLFSIISSSGTVFNKQSALAGGYAASSLYRGYPSGGGSGSYDQYMPPTPVSGDFAPNVKERKIVKAADIASEAERGAFKEAESKVKNIVASSGAYLLNQNVNKYGEDKKSYYVGYYQIKVDTTKYESVVAQLKDIGKVTSFRESQDDITGQYTNINIELESEKSKLARYNQLFDETKDIEQKIQLTDRIFQQERTIKYLEDSLVNIDTQVGYSTISLTINEKRSEYVDIIFVKFSELVRGLVGSLNNLLKFIFVILPWAVAFFIVRFAYKLIKGRQ